MYNSAGQFSTFVENFFPRGRLFRPSRRGPSAPSSVNEPASGPSAPPWPWQVGRCLWVLARGADVFSPVALASAIMNLLAIRCLQACVALHCGSRAERAAWGCGGLTVF